MRVLISRKDDDEWSVLTDKGGGGAWGIGVSFRSPMSAMSVAQAIAGALTREGEPSEVVVRHASEVLPI